MCARSQVFVFVLFFQVFVLKTDLSRKRVTRVYRAMSQWKSVVILSNIPCRRNASIIGSRFGLYAILCRSSHSDIKRRKLYTQYCPSALSHIFCAQRSLCLLTDTQNKTKCNIITLKTTQKLVYAYYDYI